jgi:thiosulfate/3-mercaptopyruvate sulfurtransferase
MSLVSVVRRTLAAAVLIAATAAAAPAWAASVEPLVSVQWLKDHLRDPQIVVIDVRMGEPVYDAGHISGAVHSDYDKAGWRVTRNGILQTPNQAELEKLIGETGIDEDSHVIVVPAGVSATDFGAAARVYWTLKVAGHPAVSILDGGFNAWQAAAYPVDSKKVVPTPKIFTSRFDEGLLAQLSAVENNEHATLVDARPASYFEGKEKASASKAYGHIPGAINIDSASFYDPATNRLRPKDQLARIAARLPTGPVVAYCNTGHWAATDWFVLSAVLGRPDVRLYPGSMVEWSANPNHPIASSRTRLDDLKKALGLGT